MALLSKKHESVRSKLENPWPWAWEVGTRNTSRPDEVQIKMVILPWRCIERHNLFLTFPWHTQIAKKIYI